MGGWTPIFWYHVFFVFVLSTYKLELLRGVETCFFRWEFIRASPCHHTAIFESRDTRDGFAGCGDVGRKGSKAGRVWDLRYSEEADFLFWGQCKNIRQFKCLFACARVLLVFACLYFMLKGQELVMFNKIFHQQKRFEFQDLELGTTKIAFVTCLASTEQDPFRLPWIVKTQRKTALPSGQRIMLEPFSEDSTRILRYWFRY